ncbi:MAG: hypothetical protein AAB686_00925 [Patescibacteria group bacterium]
MTLEQWVMAGFGAAVVIVGLFVWWRVKRNTSDSSRGFGLNR